MKSPGLLAAIMMVNSLSGGGVIPNSPSHIIRKLALSPPAFSFIICLNLTILQSVSPHSLPDFNYHHSLPALSPHSLPLVKVTVAT